LDVGQGEKFGFKKENKFPHEKVCNKGEWNWRQNISKGEKPKRCNHIIKSHTRLLGVLLIDCLLQNIPKLS
jgi:hypothetical protein